MNPSIPAPRPRSPHLQIYRPQWSSVLSITHRLSGVLLVLLLVAWLWWLMALADGPDRHADFMALAGTAPLRVLWGLLAWALFFHLFNGIRHLLWDAGWLLELPAARRSGYLVVLAATLAAAWYWRALA